MTLERRGFGSVWLIFAAVIAITATGCGSSGGSSSQSNGGADAGPVEAGTGGSAAASGRGNSQAGSDQTTDAAGAPDAGGSGGSGGSDDSGGGGTTSGGSSAGGLGEAGEAGAVNMSPACTPATFETDCPAKSCNLVSGCAGHVCQYTPVKVCVDRLAEGTFAAGILDGTVGDLTLHGNLGPFRSSDGPVCVDSTCLSGGVSP